jgi:hypothetical protein
MDVQDTAGAVSLEVHARGDGVAVEERQYVVAVGAFLLRGVEADPIVES